MLLQKINVAKWAARTLPSLRPPVSNALLYDNKIAHIKVMLVKGPNQRADFHREPGAEVFWQLKGDLNLKLHHAGSFVDQRVAESEVFYLPGGIDHSPTRPAETLGLVLERARRPCEAMDTMTWFCENCGAKLHADSFFCTDLASQLKPHIDYFTSATHKHMCAQCKHTHTIPMQHPKVSETLRTLPALKQTPFRLWDQIHQMKPPGKHILFAPEDNDIQCHIIKNPRSTISFMYPGQSWHLLLRGKASLFYLCPTSHKGVVVDLHEGMDAILVPDGLKCQIQPITPDLVLLSADIKPLKK